MRAAVALVAVAAVVTALTATTVARADGVDAYFQAGGGATMVPGNDLHVGSPTSVGARQVSGSLRVPSNTFYASAEIGFGLQTKHVVIPVLSLGTSTSAGLYDEQRSSIDGSIAHIRPWTGNLYDFGFGGIGYRTNYRRWTFAATGRFGVTYETMGADAAYGSSTYDLGPAQWFAYVRLDVEACRRLDPLERICLVASPNVFAFDQTFHGGMLSFRYELGK
jgi:hypothetical protein